MKKQRRLDGIYFRVRRDGKWQSICFSDLMTDEKHKVLEKYSLESCKSMLIYIANALYDLGEQFDIVGAAENDET